MDLKLRSYVLSPQMRVEALRAAQEQMQRDFVLREGRYRILAAFAAPNAKPSLGGILVTVVVDRTLRDHAGLGPMLHDAYQREPLRLIDGITVQLIDTASLYRARHYVSGYGVLGEVLVHNPLLEEGFRHLAAAHGLTPAAMAVATDVRILWEGLNVRCGTRGFKQWVRMGEAVLAGSLLGGPSELREFRASTDTALAAAAVDRIRQMDDPGKGPEVHAWLSGRIDNPIYQVNLVVPPEATLEARLAAMDQAQDLPPLDPEQARDGAVVVTGGDHRLPRSMRAMVLDALGAPQLQAGAEPVEADEFLL